MILDSSASTGKRPADVVAHGEDKRSEKRSRIEQDEVDAGDAGVVTACTTLASSSPKLRTNIDNSKFFTRVHLQLLKALYVSSSTTFVEDEDVDEKHWKYMQLFLLGRDSVLKMAQNVEGANVVQQELKAFHNSMTEQSLSSTSMREYNSASSAPSHQKHTRLASTSVSASARFFSGASKFGSSPGSSRGRLSSLSAKRDPQASEPAEIGNPFGIISGLHKRKHQVTSTHFRRVAAVPLQELMQDAQNRVKLLSSQLAEATAKGQQKQMSSFLMACSNKDRNALEMAEEARVTIETKLELWNLLLHDVKTAIQ